MFFCCGYDTVLDVFTIGVIDTGPTDGKLAGLLPEAFREEYRSLVRAHIEALQQAFSAVRVDYTLLDTSKPLDFALYKYLGSRQKLMKAR